MVVKKEIVNLNYLDKSLLNVKTVKIKDLESRRSRKCGLDKMYLDSFTDIKEGEVVTGTIVNVTDREVFIDIGFKSEGIVPKSEFPETPIIGEEHKVL